MDANLLVRPCWTQLFRYSAITFTGHRIHYDQFFATRVERHPGLVIHGPLQATLLYHFAAKLNDGCNADYFDFRSASALFDTEILLIHAEVISDGKLELWSARSGSPVTIQAESRWRYVVRAAYTAAVVSDKLTVY
jgi:3-methylfumaryl-CoA hydratase